MKKKTCALLTLLAIYTQTGCSSGTSTAAAAAPATSQVATVTGIDTPKSVVVVTAN